MLTYPRVSLGLPVWNGARFLAQTIDSLLAQDYPEFELIISDNGSTDDTEVICRDYLKHDERVRYHRFDVNQGAARNYNKVFELATGEYFKWAPYDDLALPGLLRRCVETFHDGPPSVVLVYPRSEIIDCDGQVQRTDSTCIELRECSPHRRLASFLLKVNLGTPVCGLLRSNVARQTRLIDSFVGADYVLLAELALRGQIREVPQVLLRRRVHSGNSRRANPSKEQTLSWYDPRNRTRILDRLSINQRLLLEYLRSTLRCPMPPAETVRCILAIPTAFYWCRLRNKGGLYKRQLKKILRRTAGSVKASGTSPESLAR